MGVIGTGPWLSLLLLSNLLAILFAFVKVNYVDENEEVNLGTKMEMITTFLTLSCPILIINMVIASTTISNIQSYMCSFYT